VAATEPRSLWFNPNTARPVLMLGRVTIRAVATPPSPADASQVIASTTTAIPILSRTRRIPTPPVTSPAPVVDDHSTTCAVPQQGYLPAPPPLCQATAAPASCTPPSPTARADADHAAECRCGDPDRAVAVEVRELTAFSARGAPSFHTHLPHLISLASPISHAPSGGISLAVRRPPPRRGRRGWSW
jgi:hypothetical protein